MDSLKLAIFDMDGLLLDTERWYLSTFGEIVEEMGYRPNKELFKTGMGSTVHPELSQLIIGAEPEEEERIKKVLYEQFALRKKELLEIGAPVKPGIPEMLEKLLQHEIKCVIVSSNSRETVKKLIAHSGLEQYFCDMVCGEDVVNGKPDPEAFLFACNRGGASIGEAIVFEDSGNGGTAAKAAGIKYMIVLDIAHVPEEILNSASAVVNNISEAIPVLEEMYGNL